MMFCDVQILHTLVCMDGYCFTGDVTTCSEAATLYEGDEWEFKCITNFFETTANDHGYLEQVRPYLTLRNYDTGEVFAPNNFVFEAQPMSYMQIVTARYG